MRDEIAQRFFGWLGFGGVGAFTGFTVADFEIWVRIAVGVLTIVSLAVHTYIAVSKHRNKK